MALPQQNISENEKNKDWCIANCRAIIQQVGNTFHAKRKERFCRNIYNGVFNDADFEYLTKIGKYDYPAKIRFIPILRPKCELLKSQETIRPFVWRPYVVDAESIERKEDIKLKEMLGIVRSKAVERMMNISRIQQQIEKQKQKIQEAQQQGGGQDEQGNPLPANEEQTIMLEELMAQLELASQELKPEQIFSEKELQRIERYYKYEFKDWWELLAERSAKFLTNELHLGLIFNLGFEDKVVLDREIYYVDYNPGKPDPEVRRVLPENFYFSASDDQVWIQDSEWCMEEQYMSLTAILDEFRDELSPKDIEDLKNRTPGFNSFYTQGTGGSYQYGQQGDYAADDCDTGGLYNGSGGSSGGMLRVNRCFWQSSRQIRVKRSKNKYVPDTDRLNWMNDDEENSLRDGESIDTGYVNDIWRGVVIDGSIFVRMGKHPVQLRGLDRFAKNQLPYIGLNKRPYSIIWAAKDIQILYNIIHYHYELWLALSGVKGMVMDRYQKPDGMSDEEWLYQRKLGTAWIQTVKEGLSRQSTFNQFQSFDDTLPASVQYLVNILQHLDELASTITGVSRQRVGSVVNSDQVGTFEQSVNQSALVTEVLYHEHDKTKIAVMERAVNLCRAAWKKGKRGSFVLGDLGQEILNIPPDTINKAEYKLFSSQNSQVEKTFNELRQMAMQFAAKGGITLGQVAKMYSIDNVKELEKSLEEFDAMMQQRAEEQQQNEIQSNEKIAQMNQQYQQMVDKQSFDLKNMELQLKQMDLDMKTAQFDKANELDNKKAQSDATLEKYDIDTQASTDMAYLEQQKIEAQADYEIERLKLEKDLKTKGTTNVSGQPKKKPIERKAVKKS